MAFSKTHRILILLAIDSAFFFLELIIGMFFCRLSRAC
jgi:Co/Zn/Cd efflux system component